MEIYDASVGVIHAGDDRETAFDSFLTNREDKVRCSIDVGDLCYRLVAYADLARFIIGCPWLEASDKRGIARVLFDRLNQMTAESPNIPEPVVQAPPF